MGPSVNYDIIDINNDIAKNILVSLLNNTNYSDSDKAGIINIINRYNSEFISSILESNYPNHTTTIDNSLDIELSNLTNNPAKYIKYYPNFNLNNTITITLNSNEYCIISKFLLRSYTHNNFDIFFKLKMYLNNTEMFTKFYNKGSIISLKQYKIILE
jgi:hypothetical protein